MVYLKWNSVSSRVATHNHPVRVSPPSIPIPGDNGELDLDDEDEDYAGL